MDHVFGEFEVGGTAMLHITDVPFYQLGLPDNLPLTAPPAEAEKIMSALPYVIGGLTVAMVSTAAYTHRKPDEPLAGQGHETVADTTKPAERR